MTNIEYKNAITKVLDEVDSNSSRIAVIRSILNHCNADFPYGENQGILAALSEKNFERWVKCSLEEAKKFANDGVPTIAISAETLFIIAPNGEYSISSSANNTEYIIPADSMQTELQDSLNYFAFSGTISSVSGRVYISPSNQGDNTGAGNYGTEKYRMEQLAQSLHCWFTANGVKSKIATLTKSIDERISESKSYGATIYLPLHSNGFNGTAQRPFTVYTKGNTNSQNLASAILTDLHNLYKLTFPNAEMRTMGSTDDYPFKEINDSLISPATGAYIEVAFHDNLDDANWIINNRVAIAECIGQSVKDQM